MANIDTLPKEISCEQCRDMLSEYVDREAAEDVRASIERHLTECTKCVTESTRLQGLKNVVRHWTGVTGSGRFRATVLQQMIRESQQTQIAPGELAQATADREARQVQPRDLDSEESKRIPPIWVLIAAAVLSVIVYFVVLKLRGM